MEKWNSLPTSPHHYMPLVPIPCSLWYGNQTPKAIHSVGFNMPPPPVPHTVTLLTTDITKCEVQYSYMANQPDELTIEPGDIINVTEKIDNDWWQGELNGTVGIFPASYVQDSS